MLRIRFQTDAEDPRPVIFPPKHPYWVTGESISYFTVIAYADTKEQLFEYFPEAKELDIQEADGYRFSDRFPCPDWFNHHTNP